jgi:hypothetical protein
MKVYIGPYRDWIGPYQIADAIFFWLEKYPSDELEKRWDYRLRDKLADWLSESWVNDVCQWIHDKKKRKVEVRIDPYDTWSVDHTLAYIILPMLKQLKDTAHGSAFTDDDDVPDELKSTSAPPKKYEYDTDDNFDKRWQWVLDQMIWSFEQKLKDNGDIQFFENGFDQEGYNKYQSRMNNGFKLFGKYYQNLWD